MIWTAVFLMSCLAHPLSSKPSTTSHLRQPVPEQTLQAIVPVSRCRATCATKFLSGDVSTKACQDNDHCGRCWEDCLKVQTEPSAAVLCGSEAMFSDACNLGCQEACLYFNYEDKEIFSRELLNFPARPILKEVSPNQWVISWSVPVSTSTDPSPPAGVVFVLLYKTDSTLPWKYGGDTVDLFATIDGQLDTYPYLEFKVIAVTSKGVVDQANFLFPEDMAPETTTASSTTSEATSSPTPAAATTATVVLDQELSTTASATQNDAEIQVILVDDALEGILTITPPSENATSVRLSWMRVSCRINYFLPTCDLPNQRFAQEVILQGNEMETVTLKDLTYNSAYMLRVTSDEQDVDFTSQDVFFMTPTCLHPDVTFLRCMENSQSEKSSLQKEGNPVVTSSSTATIVLVAFSTAAVLILLAGVVLFIWNKLRPSTRSESFTFYGGEGEVAPVPVITVDGHNYISLEHVPDLRLPHNHQRRMVYTSVPLLPGSSTTTPRSLQMTSSIAPPASDSISEA